MVSSLLAHCLYHSSSPHRDHYNFSFTCIFSILFLRTTDIQLCQWLETNDGHLKLGDFNRAEIPLFDPEKHEYCKYNNGHGYGNYRSPEEFAAKDLDEKIDIWSFGNNIYGLVSRD